MRLLIEMSLIAVLIWAFRTVRTTRVINELQQAAKRRAARQGIRQANAWLKTSGRDTRPARGRYIHDAPNYTTYTEQTGKFKAPK